MDCIFLKYGLMIEKDSLRDCCYRRDLDKGIPFIMDFDEDYTVDWKKFFELKKELKTTKIDSEKDCKGCIYLDKNLDLDGEEQYVSLLKIGHWNVCNSKCIYCCPENNGGDKYFNSFNLIKGLFEYEGGKFIRNCNDVSFLGGEPTILPEFENLIDLFASKNFTIKIHSSGIKFSESVCRYLPSGLVKIIISPDSGKKDTYFKIKRVDCFEKTWQNIEKYVSVQKNSDDVSVKFIIIPGINDTFEEVDCFLKKVSDVNAKTVIWDIEGLYAAENNYFAPNVQMLLDYAILKTKEYDLSYSFYNVAECFLKQKKQYSDELSDFATLKANYDKLKEKYKSQNINYEK